MAKEAKEKESNSTMVIALSALLALGAAGGVYYCYEEAVKAESMLERAKDEYKKMAAWKKPVEDHLRKNKGKQAAVDNTEDPVVFLDKKARESQLTGVTFTQSPPSSVGAWTEKSFTAMITSGKDAPIRKNPVVDFLRKVETERRSTKLKSLQLTYSGDEFKSATLIFSQFTPK